MPSDWVFHTGSVGLQVLRWLKKYQGSNPISIKEIHFFSDGVYSVSGRARKFVALVASVRIWVDTQNSKYRPLSSKCNSAENLMEVDGANGVPDLWSSVSWLIPKGEIASNSARSCIVDTQQVSKIGFVHEVKKNIRVGWLLRLRKVSPPYLVNLLVFLWRRGRVV